MTADPHPDSDSGPSHQPPERGDEELIAAVRAGDSEAFETLYTRHVGSARRLALALARSPSDADDLVSEAFARLLGVLRDGGGPESAFRAYLLTTVRNQFYERTRHQRRLNLTGDLSSLDAGVPFVDTAVEGLERSLVARAFARLPERWQTVLWHTQVEGETPAQIAPILGLSPNGVAALAYRARERLRQNYLREHLASAPTDECQSTIERLGAHVRDGLSSRDRTMVEHHLTDCLRCQVLFLELGDVNASLQTLLAPVVLGETAAVAYLGSGPAAGFLTPIWSNTRRIARRRSAQAGAGAAVAAAAAALALVLTGNPAPSPVPDPSAAPPAAAPEPPGAELPDPTDPPADEPTQEEAAAGDEPAAEEPAGRTPPAGEPTTPATGPTVGPDGDDPAPGGGQQPPDQAQPPPANPGTPPDQATPPPAGEGSGEPPGEPPDDPPDDAEPPDGDPSEADLCLRLGLPPLLRLELCVRGPR